MSDDGNRPAHPTDPSPYSAHRRLLLVEIGPGADFVLRDVLHFFHWEVDCAVDPATAAALLERHHYDAVVLDLWQAPGLDPVTVVDLLGAIHLQTPVVMIADHAAPFFAQAGVRDRVDTFLVRPLSATGVHVRLCELIEHRR